LTIKLSNISKKLLESVEKIEPGLAEMICYQLFDDKENNIAEKNIDTYHPEISIGLKLTNILTEESDLIKLEIGLCSLYLFKSGLSIHEEIGAGTPNINNKDTLWWKWGPAQAINAGDCLYSMSRLIILEENNLNDHTKINLLQRFDLLSNNMFKGKFLELKNSEDYKINLSDVVNTNSLREISVFQFVAELFDQTSDNMNLINIFKNIGDLYVLKNHLNGFNRLSDSLNINQTFSQLENEILNKKKIFPISYLFDEYKDSLEHQKKLGTIYMKRMIEFEDMKYLNELFYTSESSNAYKIKLKKLSQEIINNLNKLDNQASDLKNHLHEIQLL